MNKDSNPALSPPATGAPATNEIEITPAMIEAGLEHLYRYHPDIGVSDEDSVGLIFQAMFSCYRRELLKPEPN
jgi:hypothetical protein